MKVSVRGLVPAVGGLLLLTACTAGQQASPPPTTTTSLVPVTTVSTPVSTSAATTTSSSQPSAVAAPPSCPVAPTTVALPQSGRVDEVPTADQVRVRISGLAANTSLAAGGRPVEFTVSICNDSPVNYPTIAPAVVSDHCTCSHTPVAEANGTLEQFDPATGGWQATPMFSMGTGMDYLMTADPATPLPKGKEVTYRYRIAYAAGLASGRGGISATAVELPLHFQVGSADLPLTVVG